MSGLTLNHYLVFSSMLLSLGIYGLLTRRNLIAMLMSVELVLNAAALNFVAFHHYLYGGDPAGAVFPIMIIAIAAAEAAVALAIFITLFRFAKDLDVQEADTMKH